MKTTACLARLALLLGLTAAGTLIAADKAVTPEVRVTVVFDHPEKYTDVKEYDFDSENTRGRDHYLPLLKEHIEAEAGRLLAPGQKVTITFSDIDLAGDFEPWHGPRFNDIRVVKEIYPPRLTFTFRLTDENGRVVGEGERKLIDLAYQMRITGGFRDDPLRYEKDLLNDWLRTELKVRKS
ncbi:MAG: DUF3016 domain-containing protein [Opitutae bacterium]|nr:DUF3016 domain-containing protein [Opitutae bacterium]